MLLSFRLNLPNPAIHGGVMNSPPERGFQGECFPLNKWIGGDIRHRGKNPAIHGGDNLLIFLL